MIGQWMATTAESRPHRWFLQHFGVQDFHSHLRLRWIETYKLIGAARVCELGCGMGMGLIELLLRNPQATAIGYEADDRALTAGRTLIDGLRLGGRLELRKTDLTKGIPPDVADADHLLLLDILEHLPHPADTASALVQRMKPGSTLLVSVPTPLYPKVFGQAYHRSVGHLHDGFTIGQLDGIFESLERMRCISSTGPLSWPGAMLHYRTQRGIAERSALRHGLSMLATISAVPFRFVDVWNGERISCSLFAEYRKPQSNVGAEQMDTSSRVA